MARIAAYIRRDGDCRAMMEFYRECLGGRLQLTPVKDTPMAADFPDEMRDHIMHADLSTDSFTILGSDLPDPAGHIAGNDWALTVDCATERELRILFEKLSKDATVHTAPGPAAWGGVFAMLTDRFNVDWMLNCRPTTGAP